MAGVEWGMLKDLKTMATVDKTAVAAKALLPEFNRLKLQNCGFCDGWGHAGDDCPTDIKLSMLRGGVKEQSEIITQLRKEGRKRAGMGGKQGFSLLSATGRKRGRKYLEL